MEKDWLVTHAAMHAVQSDVYNGKDWLTALGNAATSFNLTVQVNEQS